jgi:hypothetical protein
VEVLPTKPDNISEKICLLFLGFNCGLQFGNLDSVVCGQCEWEHLVIKVWSWPEVVLV